MTFLTVTSPREVNDTSTYVYINDNSTYGTNFSYDIDFGDGSAHSTGNTSFYVLVYHTYTTVGTYTVTATRSGGLSGTETRTMVVTAPVPHINMYNYGGSVFAGIIHSITVTSDYGFLTDYTINWGDGSTNFTNTYLYGQVAGTHTYATSGTYTLTGTITNSKGTASTTLIVTVQTPAGNVTPSTAIPIDGATGMLQIATFVNVPPIHDAYPAGVFVGYAVGDYNLGLWYAYTAPTDGVVIFTSTGQGSDGVMMSFRDGDQLIINERDTASYEPYNITALGVPVLAGSTYYLIVASGYAQNFNVQVSWAYQQVAISGPVVYVQYGYVYGAALQAVSVADKRHETILYFGDNSYSAPGSSDGAGRYVYMNDDRFAPDRPGRLGGFVTDNGYLASPKPSLYYSDGLFAAPEIRGYGLTHRPGTDQWVTVTYDYDTSPNAQTIVAVSADGAVETWTLPFLDSPGSPYPTYTYYQLTYSSGDFFDEDGNYWIIASRSQAIWSTTYNRYEISGYSNAYTSVILCLRLNADHTGTLLHVIDPGWPFDQRVVTIAKVGNKLLLTYKLGNDQYTGGVFIQTYDLATRVFLDEFEFRPFPVLPRPAYGSETGWSYGEFYWIGYMQADPTDPNYFFMTNNASDQNNDHFFSFIFRIPVVADTSVRYAAMREPWAQWEVPENGEINAIGYGYLSSAVPNIGGLFRERRAAFDPH